MKTKYEAKWVTGTDKYECTAQFSECMNYRWAFRSKTDFQGQEKTMWFKMINPSLGEVDNNDATMKACRRIATFNKCTHFNIINFYPKRTPDVKDLSSKWLKEISIQEHFDVLGCNFIMEQLALGMLRKKPDTIFVLACGSYDKHHNLKEDVSEFMKRASGLKIMCLGHNKDGSPRHPLYISAKAPLINYELKAQG